MGRHPTRDLQRQLLVDELADDARDQVQGHVGKGCVRYLFTPRVLMAYTEPGIFANLLGFPSSAGPAEEGHARFGRAICPTSYRALTIEGERRLGPTLVAVAARRVAIREIPRFLAPVPTATSCAGAPCSSDMRGKKDSFAGKKALAPNPLFGASRAITPLSHENPLQPNPTLRSEQPARVDIPKQKRHR